MDQELYRNLSNCIRFLSIDAIDKANSGHPGLPMGMADVVTVLWKDFIKLNPHDPTWADRDRFILSAGHGSMMLYSLLHLFGYKDFTIDQIKNFRRLGSLTAGHPEVGHGVDMTTGPLGQGIATAVGMALAERMMHARYGDDLVDHYTYVVASDGDLMEGVSQEAISLAGHLKLSRLIVLFDDNDISIDGPTSLSTSDNTLKRFEASQWNVIAIDGHDYKAIHEALSKAQQSSKPTLIACKTTIGYGSPNKAGSSSVHGSPLGQNETQLVRESLNWPHEPFVIPKDLYDAWQSASTKSINAHQEWQKRLENSPLKDAFNQAISQSLPQGYDSHLKTLMNEWMNNPVKKATRQLSQDVLDALDLPYLLGGSADLTGSNNTKAKKQSPIKPGEFDGSYIHYGIREHGMACAMNGIQLHKGFIPYGGTFLTFSDYLRPAIRLSALMNQGVIYVLTHDSIGLGEDGPTHQPIEHLSSLRAIPNLHVYRPCDGIETAESWLCALQNRTTPSAIILSRQALRQVRLTPSQDNLTSFGGYCLINANSETPKISLIATGSEVELACDVHKALQEKGISAQVVSMPCLDRFYEQSKDYQEKLLPSASFKVVIEAASKQSWMELINGNGIVIGLDQFGASAPAEELFKHFGFTVENILNQIEERNA